MRYAIVFLLALLAGCATAAPITGTNAVTAAPAPAAATAPAADLQSRLIADLNQAIVDATAAKDLMAPQRVICYKTLLSLVPEVPNLAMPQFGKSAGVIDNFEHAAELAENTATVAEFQIPAEIKAKLAIDCGPLKARAGDLLLLFNLQVARVAGSIALLPK